MQYLFIDYAELPVSPHTGIDLAIRSWYEISPDTRIVVLWGAHVEDAASWGKHKMFTGIEYRAYAKDFDALKIIEKYGSDALVVSLNRHELTLYQKPIQVMDSNTFVQLMCDEPALFECHRCGRQCPSPAYSWESVNPDDDRDEQPVCAACTLGTGENHELSTERLLQMIEAGLAPVIDPEAKAALNSLRWKLAMSSDDVNVRLVVARHRDRADVGLKKCGKTTENNPLTIRQWFEHHSEELADAEVYAQVIISKLKFIEGRLFEMKREERCLTPNGELAINMMLGFLGVEESEPESIQNLRSDPIAFTAWEESERQKNRFPTHSDKCAVCGDGLHPRTVYVMGGHEPHEFVAMANCKRHGLEFHVTCEECHQVSDVNKMNAAEKAGE